MKRKHIITAAAALLLMYAPALNAQAPASAYFTDGNVMTHTMNPALMPERNYVAIPGIGGISAATMGNFGYDDVVRRNPLYPNGSDKKMTSFMNPYINNALDGFSTGKNRLGAEASIALLSAGFKAFGGYNTIEINSRTQAHISVPYELLEMAVNTGNNDYDIGDIKAEAQSFVEIAAGHSRSIGSKWRIGAKVKLLFGIADATAEMSGVRARLNGDTWTVSGTSRAHMSMKGMTYKTKLKDYDGRPGSYEKVNGIDIDGGGIGGTGFAVDIGAAYNINEWWQVSAALLDLGFIRWNNDMYAENAEDEFSFSGFHDVSIKTDHGSTIDDQADEYGDQIADFINLRDRGDRGSRTTGIGARMNIGVSYKLPCYDKMKIGMLSATRFLGSHTWTEGRLSANWTPLKWLDGNINAAVSTYTASFGWMINIHPKNINFFVGMDHLLGKMSKEGIPLSSNAAVAAGLNITW